MAKFVGANQGRISFVTDKPISGAVRVPEKFLHLSDKEIIEGCRVEDGAFVCPFGKNASELKVAFVGVWDIQCGISTYSGYLIPEIAKGIADYKIFCEQSDGLVETDKVIPCWKRGQSLSDLADRIKAYNPDVVHIQHEYGIFPDARKWLSFLTQIDKYKTFVTLHSVYRHEDKLICEAPIKNIIVHTGLARDVLVDQKGVAGNVYVIPHGCNQPTGKPRLWNLYQSKQTFMQFGFGFEYKGWENSIQACAILKKEFPNIFFTGIFSESKFNKMSHDRYFSQLMELVSSLDLKDNVSIIRGFQSDAVLDSFLRTNKVAVFPYRENGEHTVFGVTGAARVAMAHEIPVITSSVPFFYDMKDVCPQADNPEALAEAIKLAWVNGKEMVEKQNKFLTDNSWANVAQMHLDCFIK